MDDQVCPRCKTTKYRNPSLKLMVNVCGHTLCESCVDLLFLKGKFIITPICAIDEVQLHADITAQSSVNYMKYNRIIILFCRLWIVS